MASLRLWLSVPLVGDLPAAGAEVTTPEFLRRTLQAVSLSAIRPSG